MTSARRGICLEATREASSRIVGAQGSAPGLPPSVAQQIHAGLAAHLLYLVAHCALALCLVRTGDAADPGNMGNIRSRPLGQEGGTVRGLNPDNVVIHMMMWSSLCPARSSHGLLAAERRAVRLDARVDSIVTMTVATLHVAARPGSTLAVTSTVNIILMACDDR